MFITYDDLLEDWARVIRPMGEQLDLAAITQASADDVRRVSNVVEPSLRGSTATGMPSV